MSPPSCLYEGTVRHWRARPRREFRYRLAFAYIDLDDLPELLGGRLVSSSPGLVRFRRDDYLGEAHLPLKRAVGDLVQARTGSRPDGPVRVLTNLRSFGHCFNPVSFYYCMNRTGERLEAMVAEVTNTPWGERHAYVLSERAKAGGAIEGSFAKALHVSPFMGMDHTYSCRASNPAQNLSVRIESRTGGERIFDATLALQRRELTRASLADVTARYPLATLRVLGLIYAQAAKLKLAGASVFPHPGRAPRIESQREATG